MTASRTVLVGHDGSPSARSALVWALQYAGETGARVRVLRGWSMSTAPRPASMTGGYVPPIEDFEAAVVEDLRSDIAPVVAGSSVEVEYVAHHGSVAEELVREAGPSDLIVVGSRGSVTDHCVKHAACPVTVVRGD
ncbi:universal stress protein [Nocardioides sp. SR21]|uniref:universal stress protein n=1 Tax=Nocardioides sp. SR21 TaxID=2919501 RepID=UPI001FAAED94|nr:universal stress protein [Nocardioides sp. SR21]